MQSQIMDIIRGRLGERADDYRVPPPVFLAMQGEFLAFNPEEGWLTTRFPVLDTHLNPYGSMQGGMVAAAVDNTLGPLSMLLAPPNVTRRLEIKYSRPVTLDLQFITVSPFRGHEIGRTDSQQSQIGERILADEFTGEGLAVVQRNPDLVSPTHNVVIRENVSRRVYDHSGTLLTCFPLIEPVNLVGHHGGRVTHHIDVYHAGPNSLRHHLIRFGQLVQPQAVEAACRRFHFRPLLTTRDGVL